MNDRILLEQHIIKFKIDEILERVAGKIRSSKEGKVNPGAN